MLEKERLEMTQKIDIILDKTKGMHDNNTCMVLSCTLRRGDVMVEGLVLNNQDAAFHIGMMLHNLLIDCAVSLEAINNTIKSGHAQDREATPKPVDPSPN